MCTRFFPGTRAVNKTHFPRCLENQRQKRQNQRMDILRKCLIIEISVIILSWVGSHCMNVAINISRVTMLASLTACGLSFIFDTTHTHSSLHLTLHDFIYMCLRSDIYCIVTKSVYSDSGFENLSSEKARWQVLEAS